MVGLAMLKKKENFHQQPVLKILFRLISFSTDQWFSTYKTCLGPSPISFPAALWKKQEAAE